MVCKSVHELAPEYLRGPFTGNSQLASQKLRNTATDMRLPKKKSANGQKCFSYRAAKLWNSLSIDYKRTSLLGIQLINLFFHVFYFVSFSCYKIELLKC